MKTVRNLNLDHPGGNAESGPSRGGNEGNEQINQDQNHQESESRPSGGEMLNLDHPGGK